jgi:hypothetical protein
MILEWQFWMLRPVPDESARLPVELSEEATARKDEESE